MAVLQEADGGMLVVELCIGPQIAVVAVQIAGIDVRSRSHTKQVCNCSPNDRGLEAISVRDRPRRHESAKTPSADPKVVGISNSPRYKEIQTIHIVLKIANTPVAVICFRERRAGAIGSAWVGKKYGVTMRRENAAPVVPGTVKTSGPRLLWSAVIMHDRFATFSFLVTGG